MAEDLQDIYEKLLKIRTYLIKVGPDRRKEANACLKKLEEANLIYTQFNAYLTLLEGNVDKKKLNYIPTICTWIDKIKALYSEIQNLCSEPTCSDLADSDSSAEDSFEQFKMEKFDLKVALSLLPVMNDEDACTKQLIDGISYYSSILEKDSHSKLIHFVLSSRLSQSAKLKIERS